MLGDREAFVQFTKTNSIDGINAILMKYQDVPLPTLVWQNTSKVWHEMKALIVLSVLMPKLIGWLLSLSRRQGDSHDSSASRKPWRLQVVSTVSAMLRTTLSVLAMPASFWVLMFPLVTRRFGGPHPHIFQFKTVLALLPTVSALISLAIEGQRRAKLFAIFMACTAVS